MPSPASLRRLANLTKKVRSDLRSGGMASNFRYVFRSTAILARIVEVLADQVATMAEEQQRLEQELQRYANTLRTADSIMGQGTKPGLSVTSTLSEDPSTT